MERTLAEAAVRKKIGEPIAVMGWVSARRDHGKLIFIDLRDRSGVLQLVFTPKHAEVYENAQEIRDGWVIRAVGEISKRPAGMENSDLPTGAIELPATELEILNRAETPPFPLDDDGYGIEEERRLEYRYLDLRRGRLQKNIKHRSRGIKFIRDFLVSRDFVEIETPILSKSTPEGARDFLVPSRREPGSFYALPQSPQQYKQLLMVAGFERYFQIARCFRDEDTRGDRQPEFTQLDLEMSFVEPEDVMALTEELLIGLVNAEYPEKHIQQIPFPRMAYREAMDRYGTDRPDLRKDKDDPNLLAFCWIMDFPFFEKDSEGKWTFTHNPFSRAKQEYAVRLMEKKNIEDILTTQYDITLNGYEIGGGSIRNHEPAALKKVFEIMGLSDAEISENFGHMIAALGRGAPPHGGIAPGLDRLFMVLENEPNIREVMAFPKTGDGRDPMMGAPSPADSRQLRELSLEIRKPTK